jgi:hypothetical protein
MDATFAVILPGALLLPFGFDPQTYPIFQFIATLEGLFAHANVDVRFKGLLWPLKLFVLTPEFHHHHHSDHYEAWGKNFAVGLPVIDWIFGTWYLPDHWPDRMGVSDAYLQNANMLKEFIYPFKCEKDDSEPLKHLPKGFDIPPNIWFAWKARPSLELQLPCLIILAFGLILTENNPSGDGEGDRWLPLLMMLLSIPIPILTQRAGRNNNRTGIILYIAANWLFILPAELLSILAYLNRRNVFAPLFVFFVVFPIQFVSLSRHRKFAYYMKRSFQKGGAAGAEPAAPTPDDPFSRMTEADMMSVYSGDLKGSHRAGPPSKS